MVTGQTEDDAKELELKMKSNKPGIQEMVNGLKSIQKKKKRYQGGDTISSGRLNTYNSGRQGKTGPTNQTIGVSIGAIPTSPNKSHRLTTRMKR